MYTLIKLYKLILIQLWSCDESSDDSFESMSVRGCPSCVNLVVPQK
jgi:hypothetical protein